MLNGIKVLDFTHVLAGPACSYYLGLLGADVIKVESVLKGDAMRHRGGTYNEGNLIGMSTPYLTQASGKRSIAIDINTKKGFEIWLIPHTLKLTNLSTIKKNTIVNIEFDILSKYVKNYMS